MYHQKGFAHYLVLAVASLFILTSCFFLFRLNPETLQIQSTNETEFTDQPKSPNSTLNPSPSPQAQPNGIPLGPQSDAFFNRALEGKARNNEASPASAQSMIEMDPSDWSLPINVTTCFPEEVRILSDASGFKKIAVKTKTEGSCILTYSEEIAGKHTEKECIIPRSEIAIHPISFNTQKYCK